MFTINLALLENKLGRKPIITGLILRKYVVLKSLLRKIHSFYWKDIKQETQYLKHKSKSGVQVYEKCLQLYIQNKFQEEPSDDFVLTLGSIACSRDMEEFLRSKSQMIFMTNQESYDNQLVKVSSIHETLSKFSFSKYQTLAKRPEMFKIMTYFLSRIEDSLTQDEKIGFQILFEEWTKN